MPVTGARFTVKLRDHKLVGAVGVEPTTFPMSREHSAAELCAYKMVGLIGVEPILSA
jgi:hypothetical protein